MTAVEYQTYRPAGRNGRLSNLGSTARQKFDHFARSPSLAIPLPNHKRMKLATDRVRARPAISPNLSMMIGMTALGLGAWGLLFPRSVKRTLGVASPPGVIRLLFGAREMASGAVLASDPTRADMLWGRVAADVLDIAVLAGLTRAGNPRRGTARLALDAVLAITVLDAVTAFRMSTVKRNCE